MYIPKKYFIFKKYYSLPNPSSILYFQFWFPDGGTSKTYFYFAPSESILEVFWLADVHFVTLLHVKQKFEEVTTAIYIGKYIKVGKI